MTGIFKADQKPKTGIYTPDDQKTKQDKNYQRLGRCKNCQGKDLELDKAGRCKLCKGNKISEKDDDGTIYDLQ